MNICNKQYIYRYMSYSEFLDIVRFRRLTLRYPGIWPDKLELLFLRCFENDEYLNKLTTAYHKKIPNYSDCDIKSDFQILSSVLIKTRCQCWTYKEDDLVMWNERNSNETVRICVSKESFDKYEKACEEGKIVHRDISYQPKITCENLFDSFIEDRKVPHFIFTKKDVFEYEHEHRLALFPKDHCFHTASYGNTMSECLQRHFFGIKSEFGMLEKYFDFNINDIENVKVNPNASNAFADLVKYDCDYFGLKYNGISQILI